MHTLVLHLQDITDCLCSSDPIIRKCKNLIQEQKIAFLRCDHFARKIQSIENIGFLLCLLLLIQFLISFIMLLKTEYLNIQIIQFLQKIQFPALSSFQKLNNNDAFTQCGSSQTLTDRQRCLSLSPATVNLCKFFFHNNQFLLSLLKLYLLLCVITDMINSSLFSTSAMSFRHIHAGMLRGTAGCHSYLNTLILPQFMKNCKCYCLQ